MFAESEPAAAPGVSADDAVFELAVLEKPQACGPLSKHWRIGGDGAPELIEPGGAMWAGAAVRLPLPNFAALSEVLASCTSYQAITLGSIAPRFGEGPFEVVTVRERDRRAGNTGQSAQLTFLARTKGTFEFREAAFGIMLADYDQKGMPAEVRQRIESTGGIWNVLVTLCPELAGTACIIRSSTSAGLSNTDTGTNFPGSGGAHIYWPVMDASDIPRALKVLFARAWIHGFGWIWVSEAGSRYVRGVIDVSVGSPERLVFEGAPKLDPPLIQDLEARKPAYTPGTVLDTRKALPELTASERAQYEGLVRRQRDLIAPESERVRTRVVGRKAKEIANRTGKPVAEVERRLRKTYAGILMPDCELVFDRPEIGTVTVREVLGDPERFIGETLSDPLEGPSYGRNKALVMRRNDGSEGLIIHSFAHGGLIYELRLDAVMVKSILDAEDPATVAQIFAKLLAVSELEPDERQHLRRWVAEKAKIGVRDVDEITKRVEEEIRKKRAMYGRAAAASQHADQSDRRPRIMAPIPDADYTGFVTQLDEVMSEISAAVPPMRDFDGRLVRIVKKPPDGTHALTGSAGERAPAPPEPLIKRLEDSVEIALEIEKWVKVEARKPKGNVKASSEDDEDDEPREVHLLANYYAAFNALAERSKLPICRAVQTLPLVIPPRIAGEQPRILSQNGLDRASQLVMMLEEALVDILPKRPTTLGEATQALGWLKSEWLKDVASTPETKVAIVAAALTLIERPIFDERPGFIVTAGMRAVGKSTLINAISAAIFGRRAAASAWSNDVEERRKALMAALFEGQAVIVWDNVPRGSMLSCPHIERAMTSTTVGDRLLGSTKTITAAATSVFFWTGNMIAPKGDLASRVIVLELIADRPDPENRPMRPDFVGWTLAHRREILAALYKILMLERPACADAALTRFKTWYETVAWPLEQAGASTGIHFGELFARNTVLDEDEASASYILSELNSVFGDRFFIAAEVENLFRASVVDFGPRTDIGKQARDQRERQDRIEHLTAAFNGLGGKPLPPPHKGEILAPLIGQKLRILAGRVISLENRALKLVSQRGERNTLRWRVVSAQEPAGTS